MPPQVSSNTLVDDVKREMRQMILSGSIEPRGFLPTRKEVADRFGVGLSTIHEAMQRVEKCIDDDDAFVEADLDFHLGVAHASGNDLLEQFYRVSQRLIAEAIHEIVGLPGVKQASMPYQRAILIAIERGNPEKAERAALGDVAYVDQLLERWDEMNGAITKEREAYHV